MPIYERIAFGLTKHPTHGYRHLLGRFAQHVSAATYWDLYDDTADAAVMARQIVDMMYNAQSIHFNLDGMLNNGVTLVDIYQRGVLGAGEGNWTNWEFFIIASDQVLFDKTTFYFDGTIMPDGLAVV